MSDKGTNDLVLELFDLRKNKEIFAFQMKNN